MKLWRTIAEGENVLWWAKTINKLSESVIFVIYIHLERYEVELGQKPSGVSPISYFIPMHYLC